MSKPFWKLAWLFIVLIVAGCQANPSITPTSPPEFVQVGISPTLNWLTTAINTCSISTGTVVKIILSDPLDAASQAGHDVSISLIPTQMDGYQFFELGNGSFVVVVNNQNPIQQLSQTDWDRILNGEVTTWKEVLPADTASDPGLIDFWVYPPESPLTKLISEFNGIPGRQANIAPGYKEMQEAVKSNSGAIGILPQGALLDDEIKMVPIEGQNWAFLIVASVNNSRLDEYKPLLFCIQTKIQE